MKQIRATAWRLILLGVVFELALAGWLIATGLR